MSRNSLLAFSVAVALLLCGVHGGAQGAHAAAAGIPTRAGLRSGVGPPPAEISPVEPPPPSPIPGGQRSPTVAWVASFFVPGLGSFYAGHARHGITHLGIHVVAGTYLFAGTTSCVLSWGGETDCPGDDVMAAVGLAWLANWGWSVISAAHDAEAHNARR